MPALEKPGYIDGILSTRFDECSIAAADAARLAHSRLEEDEDIKNWHLQVIGNPGIVGDPGIVVSENVECSTICDLLIEDDLVSGNKAKILLARSKKHEESPTYLGVLINTDTLLPIASFEKRANGQCSYVQLGQEIHEDDLVVTPDEPRNIYVEAIRSLMGCKIDAYGRISNISDDHVRLIQTLVLREVDRYKGVVERAMHPTACKQAEKYFKEVEHKSRLVYMLGDERDERVSILCSDLTLPTGEFSISNIEDSVVDGRVVRLALARETRTRTVPKVTKKLFRAPRTEEIEEQEPVGNLQLLAITRDNIALRLAQFSDSELVLLDESGSLANEKVMCRLLQVLSPTIEARRAILQEAAVKYRFIKSSPDTDTKYLIVNSGGNEISVSNREYANAVYESGSSIEWSGVKNKLKGHVYNLGNEDVYHAFHSNYDQELLNLYKLLEGRRKFDAFLGVSETPTEKILTELGRLASGATRNYNGVLTNRKAGKTVTDVAVEVTIDKRTDREVKINVTGRPLALDGFDPVTLFEESLHFDRINEQPQDKMAELAELLGTICVLPSLTAKQ